MSSATLLHTTPLIPQLHSSTLSVKIDAAVLTPGVQTYDPGGLQPRWAS